MALVGRRQDVLDQLSQDINRDINRARPDATGAPAAPLARAYAHDVRHYDEVPRLLARIGVTWRHPAARRGWWCTRRG